MTVAKTVEAWKKAKTHDVTCPSGATVTIEVPNLALLAKTGQIPNALITAAVGVLQGEQELTPELLADQWEFYRKLVLATVKQPEGLTEDDVAELPYEDVEFLVEIASRQRDFDAVGHHLGGLETNEAFRAFHRLDGLV